MPLMSITYKGLSMYIIKVIKKIRCLVIVFILSFEVSLNVLVSGSILVLLVFRNKIVQVRFSLSEFHLVHTLSGVPVKESLSTEHHCELISNTLPCLLDGSGVTYENT